MNPAISVIVPVYNTEKYLDECILSILNQSFTDFELLLIDDGSTDRSGAICDAYASQDERVRVFHKKNGGVTSARKLGVEKSESELICFVDSDDMLLEGGLQILYDRISDNVDIVIATGKFIDEDVSRERFICDLLENDVSVSLWGKLYKKELIVNTCAMDIRKEVRIGEDYLANLKMGLAVQSVVYLSVDWNKFYIYRDTPNSAMHRERWSLEYEEMFRSEVEKVIGNEMDSFRESWYKFQLRILENLIIHRIKFSYHKEWIHKLLRNKFHVPLSFKEKIIVYVRNAFLCRYLLAVERRLNRYWR